MVAATLTVDDLDVGSSKHPRRYTVDTLFELPETDKRFEVLGGNLSVSPSATPRHARFLQQLIVLFSGLLPPELAPLPDTAIRLPNGDGPVPDMLISSVDVDDYPRGIPAELVYTVFEVVSPSNAYTDRKTKSDLYAEAGIPCYWRVEQRPWPEHFGPVPAIVVRLRDNDGEWQQTIAAAGAETELPIVVDADGTIVTVTIDPATLVGRRSA
ncbi:MAG: hypothetical protein AUI10_08365 [Actinobacteria bacterium 13_2_20CM_2_72_6]|nr:MAG: hypothetical protein AUI10_08365 [Actinobacteria bacterium 13_2_20CM_2_72_6]